MGSKTIVYKNLDKELFEAKITIDCLKNLLIQKGVCTEKEINDSIDSEMVAYKLSDEQITFTATSARWS